MKNLKTFDEKFNEELNYRKALATGALATTLALGGGGYLAHRHDKNITPMEQAYYHVNIPNSFKMKEKILSWGTDMYITNDNKDNFGKIEERTMNIGGKFEYFDNNGKLVATAKQKALSLFDVINISDENGIHIGSVEQAFLKSKIYTIYSIKDANGNVIAKSEKVSFVAKNVTISDLNGNEIINFHRGAFSPYTWEVNILDNSLDKRLIVFIPSFITD